MFSRNQTTRVNVRSAIPFLDLPTRHTGTQWVPLSEWTNHLNTTHRHSRASANNDDPTNP